MEYDFSAIRALMEKFSKACPKCLSHEISSDNSTPLNHTCLRCGHKFPESEAIQPK